MGLRVTFVLADFPHFSGQSGGAYFHGIASMSAMLKNAGHRTRLIQVHRPVPRREFLDLLLETRPDLVGFSAITHFFPRVREWAEWTREATRVPIIVGGPHAILDPEGTLAAPGVDFVCTGEGEHTLLELCDALEAGRPASGITGTWARTGDGVRRNPPRPLIEDLDALPAPDYDLFDYRTLHAAGLRRISVMISRGCPYRCSYCANARIRDSYPNPRRYARHLSPGVAVDRLASLVAAHPGCRGILFNDNLLYPDRAWLRAFAPAYRRRVGLPFIANTRPNLVDDETVALLREAGAFRMCMGVESGDEEIANRVLRRGQRNAVIREAFRRFREAGIETSAYNILGAPRETVHTMLRTVRLNAQLRPDWISPFIYYPIPGTESYDLCRREGWLTDRAGAHNSDRVMIRQPTVADDEVLFMHRWFRPLVRLYRRVEALPAPVAGPVGRALDRALTSPRLPRRSLVALKEAHGRMRERLAGVAPRRF